VIVLTYSVRERQKLARRSRIKAAAWKVFRSKGWEAATTREIAKQAGIASGTLFLYAHDKRELLLMIINDELEGITERTLAGLKPRSPLLDQIIAVFGARFTYWAESGLSRAALGEIFSVTAPSTSIERQRFDLRRAALVARIAEIVTREQSAGRIRKGSAPADVAALFMALYRGQLLDWIATEPLDPDVATARLRTFFQAVIEGLRGRAK
jgi:AcrR family transcriptional regulator